MPEVLSYRRLFHSFSLVRDIQNLSPVKYKSAGRPTRLNFPILFGIHQFHLVPSHPLLPSRPVFLILVLLHHKISSDVSVARNIDIETTPFSALIKSTSPLTTAPDPKPKMEHPDAYGKAWLPNFLRSKTSSPTSTPPNEHSSLLPKANNHPFNSSNASEGETYEVDEHDSPTKEWISEFMLLLRASVPVIVAYTLQNSLQTFSVLVVGRLSPEALATAAFSYMFAMCTAWLIALGGTTALDTLASSTFTGSKNPHDLGILLQRSFLVLTAFYVPVAILWACSAPLFRLLGQEEYICVDSAKFLTALIPGGLGYIYFETMKKYLQSQGTSIIASFHFRTSTHYICKK